MKNRDFFNNENNGVGDFEDMYIKDGKLYVVQSYPVNNQKISSNKLDIMDIYIKKESNITWNEFKESLKDLMTQIEHMEKEKIFEEVGYALFTLKETNNDDINDDSFCPFCGMDLDEDDEFDYYENLDED